MKPIYSKRAAKAIGKINNPPETEPAPDEIESIKLGRDEIRRGDIVNHDEINWN